MARTYEVALQINGRIGNLQGAIDRANRSLRNLSNAAQTSSATASRATMRLQDRYLQLQRNLTSTQNYRSLNAGIGDFTARTAAARQETQQLLTQFQAQERLTNQMRQSFARLQEARQADRSSVAASTVQAARRELGEQEQRLRSLQRQYQQSRQNSDSLNQSLQAQTSQLRELQSAFQAAGIGADDLASHERNLQSQLNSTTSRLTQSQNLDNARSRHANSAQNLSYAYGNFQGAVDLGKTILSPITSSVEVYANFDATLSQLKAVTGVSGAAFDALSAKAREMGKTTQFSATQAAEAMVKLGKTGWTDQQILGGIRPLLQTAIAGGADLAATADIVSDTMSAFGKVAGQNMTTSIGTQVEATQRFADVFAATASNANTDINLMGETFKYAAATAGSLGYSIEDVALATGIMGNNFVKGSMAGTALNSIMTRLVAPPSEAEKSMSALGVEVKNADGTLKPFRQQLQDLRGKFKNLTEAEKAEHAQKIAGTEAMKGFLALMNTADEDFERLAGNIDKSAGATDRMAETMANNLSGDLKSLESASESVQLSLGKLFEPAQRSAAQFATAAARSLESFIAKNPAVVQAVGGVVAAISGLIVTVAGFSVLSAGINFLKTGFDLMRLTAMTTASSISGAFSAIAGRATQAATSVRTFWAANTMSTMASSAATAVRNLGSAFLSAGRAALTFVISPIGLALAGIALAGLYIYNNWSTLAPVFSEVAGIIGGTLQSAISSVGPAISNLINALSNGGAISNLVTAFSSLANAVGPVLVGAILLAVNVIGGAVAGLANIFSGVVSTVANVLAGIVNIVNNVIQGNWSAAWQNAKQIVVDVFSGIAEIVTAPFKAIGDTIGNIKSSFEIFSSATTAPPASPATSASPTVAPIDTANAQAQVDNLGNASNSAATATNAFASSVETNSNAAQNLNQNISAIGEGATQLSANLTAVGTEFTNVQTGTQGAAMELTNLQTNSQTTALELTNLQTNLTATSPQVMQLGTDAQTSASGVQTLGQAASQTAGSLSQIDGAASAVASALSAKAAEISSIHISVPQVTTVPVAANAHGGIYNKGAFLTTFAEESPEAAIPLDGSPRAKQLWTQAGQILGMLPGNENVKMQNGANNISFSDKIKLPEKTPQNFTSGAEKISKQNFATDKITNKFFTSGDKNFATDNITKQNFLQNSFATDNNSKNLSQETNQQKNFTFGDKIFDTKNSATAQNIFQNFSLDNALKFFEGESVPREVTQPQMPINISITIAGNADERTMQAAGNEIAFNLQKQLDDWWREKNHDAQRRSF